MKPKQQETLNKRL